VTDLADSSNSNRGTFLRGAGIPAAAGMGGTVALESFKRWTP
jgi:hypothetical protein